jgi:hypothetical protein
MTSCVDVQRGLDSLLDGEASTADQLEIERHVGDCAECQRSMTELSSLRSSLQQVFRATMGSAPPIPERLLPRRPMRRLRLGLAAGAAAALAVAAFVLVFPQRRLDASPLATLKRAASAYQRLDDVELWVSVESQAAELLERLVNETVDHRDSTITRVFLRSPGLMLVQKLTDPRAPPSASEPIQGWDGRVSWSYDPEEAVVHLRAEPPLEVSLSDDAGQPHPRNLDLMQYLSWKLVRELAEADDSFAIEERTGPSDKRAGRRVMRVTPRARPDEDGVMKKLFWAGAQVTVDADEDRIEKLVVDVSFAGLSLLRFTVEVARFQQHYPAAFFDYRSHVPAGTPVIREPRSAR